MRALEISLMNSKFVLKRPSCLVNCSIASTGCMLDSVRRVRRSRDPVERIRSVAEACVRFGLRNPSQIQVLTALRPDQSDPPQSSAEARELLEGPLRELQEQGRLLRDPEEAFQCLWIAMHGVMSMLSLRPDYAWSKQLVRVSIEAMLRGLMLPAEAGNGRAQEGVS